MATEIVGGQTKWAGGRDEEGHRTYQLYIQTVGSLLDGPASHMLTPGVPVPGSVWAYDNDYDPYAWCSGAVELTPREDRGNIFYDHKYTFTTRPRGSQPGTGRKDDRGQKQKCADLTIEDPLSEPTKTSGGFVRNSEEATRDSAGQRLRMTNFEPMTGPQAEFDRSRMQVTAEYNDISLDLEDIAEMIDTVNDGEMWGLPARCWKLCEFHWERKLYGTCGFYYTKRFVFESNADVATETIALTILGADRTAIFIFAGETYSRWDHHVPDVCSTTLHGKWDKSGLANGQGARWVVKDFQDGTTPNYTKPNHYIPIPDPTMGSNVRRCLSRNTPGVPAATEADENCWLVKLYRESDFLGQLQLPVTL